MDILPSDLAPGENPSQLGIISRPFSPQLHAEPTTAIEKIREAYYSLKAAEAIYEVVGVDASVWQGIMNWATTKPLVDFAIIRAGYGTSSDTQLNNNQNGCVQYEIPFGYYWYVTPQIDWRSISRTFADIYLQLPCKITPVMDVEASGDLSKTALTAYIRNLLIDFEQRTAVRPMIYTSASFWNTYLTRSVWAKLYKLWVANYTAATSPYMPADWTKWTIWQWSSKGNGAGFGAQSKYIDLNRYWGTKAQFAEEFNLEQHDVYIPVVVDMQVSATSTPYLNVRATPSTSGAVVGRLLPETKFQASDFGGASTWAKIAGGEFDGNWVCVQLNEKRFCELESPKV